MLAIGRSALKIFYPLEVLMEVVNRLASEECNNLEDIRGEIDHLDRAVIALLGKRFKYVLAAARFKTSETSLRAPDTIEKLYIDLVQYFTEEEMKRWKFHQAQNNT